MPIPLAALAAAAPEAAAAAGGEAAAGGSGLGNIGSLFSNLSANIKPVSDTLQPTIKSLQQFNQTLRPISQSIDYVKNVFGRITGVFQKMGALIALPVTMAVKSVELLTDTFHKLAPVVLETVGLFQPLALLQFNRAMMDLKAVFGSMFLPVLNEVTSLVRTFANYFYSLPASFKAVITSLARTTIILGTVAALGSLFVTLGGAMVTVKAIFGPFVYLFEQFKKSAGGAGALSSLINTIEGLFTGIIGAVQGAWEAAAGVRQRLANSLGSLGESFSDLLKTLSPLLDFIASSFEGWLTFGLKMVGGVMNMVVSATKALVNAFNGLLAPFSAMLKLLGYKLPDISGRTQKSAMGLGWAGASVTDPASLYNKLTEEIARNSRPGEKEEDPVTKSANTLGRIEVMLDQFIKGGLAAIIGGVPAAEAINSRLGQIFKSALLGPLAGM